MNDEQLLRDSRQIMLPLVGVEGQQRLIHSRVLVLGLGGLGSPVAMYLTVAGIGRLPLLDAVRMEWRSLTLRKDPACPICG